MKKTILGTLIVILTTLNQASFAQGIAEVETQRDEYIQRLVRNAISIYKTYRAGQRNLYSFANIFGDNQPTIIAIQHRQIPAEKAFDLNEKIEVTKSNDEGASRTLTSGHLKILGLTFDKKKVAVEYFPTQRLPEQPGASEVYLVNVDDLGINITGQN